MRKNAFIAIDHIKDLNLFKSYMISRGELLDEKDFRVALKKCGLPSNILFWTMFKKSGLIQSVEGNLYIWKSNKPIHYIILKDLYIKYQKRVNEYSRNKLDRIRSNKMQIQSNIKEAIALLKENGYEVFIPYGNLYKKM